MVYLLGVCFLGYGLPSEEGSAFLGDLPSESGGLPFEWGSFLWQGRPPKYGQPAGGTHPTGIPSCYLLIYCQSTVHDWFFFIKHVKLKVSVAEWSFGKFLSTEEQ